MSNKFIDFVNKNSNNILIASGLVSMVSGTVFACKASIKIFKNVEKMKEEKLDKKTIIKKNIKHTILPSIMIVGGVGMIIAANKVSNKRFAALASAYTSTSIAFNQFKEKTQELVKANQLEKIKTNIADENVANEYKGKNSIVITGKGDCIIFEPLSKQYISSNWNEIEKKANELNADALEHGGSITLNAWLLAIGADTIGVGKYLQWNPVEDGKMSMLKVEKTSSITPDDQPCLCIHYVNEPVAVK